jgi:hypothetical protein
LIELRECAAGLGAPRMDEDRMSFVMLARRFFFCFAAVFALAIATAGSAGAETYSKPVYNEVTKSYFQFVSHGNYNWLDARGAAERMVYKNVRGRLAVVQDPRVTEFLRENFEPEIEVWIGLRYFCGAQKSLWVNGQFLSRSEYQNWASQWYRNQKITCFTDTSHFEFMPVYYQPIGQGFRWQASGPLKRFYGFFVEFPTGAP